MSFEIQKTPWHPVYGYNGPHLPYGTEPEEEKNASNQSGDSIDESGDVHEFSEVEEVQHEEPVTEDDATEDTVVEDETEVD